MLTNTAQDAPLVYAYGMMWTLVVGTVWLAVASYYGWNVSSTHSIIGAYMAIGGGQTGGTDGGWLTYPE